MPVISRKYVKGDETTVFRLESNNNIAARLFSAKLDRDDWEIIQGLLGFVYNQGLEAGSKSRATEIRRALGLENE